jgi:hypothetical protein
MFSAVWFQFVAAVAAAGGIDQVQHYNPIS